MSEENDEATSSVTFKADKGYDAPWFVVRGTPAQQRDEIIEAFGFNAEATAEWTLVDLIAQAAVSFHATYRTASSLGGKPLTGMAVAPGTPYAGPTGDAAWGAAEKTDGSPFKEGVGTDPNASKSTDPLIASIEQVTTKPELAALWAANKERFSEPAVKAAAEKAGKRIKG